RAPGLVQLMIARGLESTPMAALARGTAGTVGDRLVVNLPGSPKGARENLEALLPVLPHVLQLLGGDTEHRCPNSNASWRRPETGRGGVWLLPSPQSSEFADRPTAGWAPVSSWVPMGPASARSRGAASTRISDRRRARSSIRGRLSSSSSI